MYLHENSKIHTIHLHENGDPALPPVGSQLFYHSVHLSSIAEKKSTCSHMFYCCFFQMAASRLTSRRLVGNGHYHIRSHHASNSVASQRKCTSTRRRCSRVATGAPYPSHANAQQPDADASRWVPTQARALTRTHPRRRHG